jgi:hypothetical protein
MIGFERVEGSFLLSFGGFLLLTCSGVFVGGVDGERGEGCSSICRTATKLVRKKR